MNEEFYEKEIRKNMEHLETLNSKANISEDKELPIIVDQWEMQLPIQRKQLKI